MAPLVVSGNWKMNHDHLETIAVLTALQTRLKELDATLATVTVHPPFTSLRSAQVTLEELGSFIKLGAQDCFWEKKGAFTGEVSPSMLKRLGVEYVIVGHSERRNLLKESDEMVARKVRAVLEEEMTAILCVGELLEQRQAERHHDVVKGQLEAALAGLPKKAASLLIVAYEPVWAIGTGVAALPEQIEEMVTLISQVLKEHFGSLAKEITIQYGGSVSQENAAQIFSIPGVDGALVGSASLDANSFSAIVEAACKERLLGRTSRC